LEGQHTGHKRRHRDDEEDLGPCGAKGILEDQRYRVSDVTVHDGLEVRRGQHVSDLRQQPGDATDEDSQHHRIGDPTRGVVDLLSDVAAGLEPVEEEQAAEGRSEEREEVGLVTAGPKESKNTENEFSRSKINR
jgi:hypothetical protein